MNSQFIEFLKLGFGHISDINGYDHILFIITLCSVYHYTEWKKVTILVTAFTIGHSITLALAAMKIIVSNAYLIEILIPVTILATCLYNLLKIKTNRQQSSVSYFLALGFGLIHGLGFSNFFNIIFGENLQLGNTLLAFNIGLEIGQLLIVGLFFGLYFVVNKYFKVTPQVITFGCTTIALVLSSVMIIQRI